MMTLRLTIFTMALIFSGLAFGALDRIESVLELELSDIRLPAHEVDMITIRRCDECRPLNLQATGETVYRIGGFDAPKVSLQEFKAAIRKIRRKSQVLLYVGYVPDTKDVTRIVVSGGAK
jgi:hypothetical protein